jgi:retron-type reverse transcriptase
MWEFFLVYPQGDPLSPLPSNIMFTEFDRGLRKRGHKFCSYAEMTTIFMLIVRRQEKELWAA